MILKNEEEMDSKSVGFKVLRDYRTNENPAVSVVIPTYNAGEYLKECIDSMTGQSLKNIEIICVNDGSTDGTEALLDSTTDPRLVVCIQNNSGQSVARNNGMSLARGEYIYFMDSDDLLEPDGVDKLYKQAKSDSLDLLCFDGDVFSNESTGNARRLADTNKNFYRRFHEYAGIKTGPALMASLLSNEEYRPSPCLYIIKKDMVTKEKLSFCPGIVHEDNIFTYHSFLCAKRAAHTGDVLFHRRYKNNSVMTSDTSIRHVYGYLRAYIEMNFIYERTSLRGEEEAAAVEILSRIAHHVRSSFMELDDDQKDLINNLPPYEKHTFQIITGDLCHLLSKKRELEDKLHKTYAEKSELNAKLQQTYAEKSELNAKLQQTYAEKSQRGVRIKELKHELNKVRENNKTLKKKLTAFQDET